MKYLNKPNKKGKVTRPPPLKKVTKVTRIADIDIKLFKVKNKWKGDRVPSP